MKTEPQPMTVSPTFGANQYAQRTKRELDFGGNEHLKSLVEAMQGTGLFEVFRVSQGKPNLISSQAPIVSFWADAESARALSNLLIDELGRSNIPGNLWCLDVGFPRVLPHRVVGHLRCCKFDEDAKSFWKSVWRFILKRQEVDRDFSVLRDLVVLNFQKGKQEEHGKTRSWPAPVLNAEPNIRLEEDSLHEVISRTQTAEPKTTPHVLFIVVVTVISTHFLTMLAFVPGFVGK